MAGLLSASGTLSYNGITFDSLYHSTVSGRPVYDPANRMVKMIEWTIAVTGYVNAGSGITVADATMTSLRQKLTQPGAALAYANKGFGPLYVNYTDPTAIGLSLGMRDVNWGPKPELLDFKPVGNSQTVLVNWKVKVCIPECPTAVYEGRPMAITFSFSQDIDTDGYSVVTYAGELEIPLTFVTIAALQANDNADNYRDLVRIPLELGFQRQEKYELSKDRKTLTFTISDKEIPIALPYDCTICDLKHEVKNTSVGFSIWTASISGTIRTNPKVPRITAYDRFLAVVVQRTGFSRFALRNLPPLRGQAVTRRDLMLTDLKITEDIFGKDSSFSVTYKIFGADLTQIVGASGLWRATDTDFGKWRDTMTNTEQPYNGRGNRRVFFRDEGDVMIDLCNAPPPEPDPAIDAEDPVPPPTSNRRFSSMRGYGEGEPMGESPAYRSTPIPGDPDDPVELNLGNFGSGGNSSSGGGGPNISDRFQIRVNSAGRDSPDPANSWLKWECRSELQEDDHIVRHKPLSGQVTVKKPKDNPLFLGGELEGEEALVRATVDDRMQRLYSPSQTLRLVGWAVRFGHKIAPPRLVSYKGKTLTQADQDIQQWSAGSIQGIPIWVCTWDIAYLVTGILPHLPTIANPENKIQGN